MRDKKSSSSSSRGGPGMAGVDRGVEVSKKGLEVANTGSGSGSAGSALCTAALGAGRWYYEVRLLASGNVRVGWAAVPPGLLPAQQSGPLGADAASWGVDGCQRRAYHAGDSQAFPAAAASQAWAQGDIVGCALDTAAGTISYTHNGESLGVAFTGVAGGGAAAKFAPAVTLHRRMRVLFNFGAEDFCTPLPGFSPVHSRLSSEELAALERLFASYAAKGDAPAAAAAAAIEGEGLLALAADLGQRGDMDPLLLVLVWKLGCKRQWVVTHDEFVGGFAAHGVGSIDAARRRVAEWKQAALRDAGLFEELYNFVFEYLRGEAKTLAAADALMAWQTLELDKRWALWPAWERFWKSVERKNISRDNWQQLVPFMARFPASVDKYDEQADCCWPSLYDEFVEFLRH